MLRMLSSPLVTVAVFAAMAIYLIQGRFFGGSLGPGGMIMFASVLILQSLVAFVNRLVRTFRMAYAVLPPKLSEKGFLIGRGRERATEMLINSDFKVKESGSEELGPVLIYSRNEKHALVIEIISYGLLLFMLVLGIINYGISVRGHISLSPGGEWSDLGKNLQRTRLGFMADRAAIPLEIRATDLSHGTSGRPSEITVEIAQKAMNKSASVKMRPGDIIEKGKFLMLYTGDIYTAFITVKREEHDLMAAPIRLVRKADSNGPMLYHGKLYLNFSEATGEGWFDPVSELFRVRLFVQSELRLDRTFSYGDNVLDGDYFVTVTALSHAGRLEIWRKNFKNALFVIIGLLCLSVVMRLIFRVETVYLWNEGDNTFYYTKSLNIKRILHDQS